ncbi:MAG: PfkB family carbohydrate kinase, partial [Acidimicrobiales bacterium]
MLLCVGDLIEDVVVWLPGPVALGSDTVVRITRERGGSAANAAAAAVRAGGRARFVGQLGDDELAHR